MNKISYIIIGAIITLAIIASVIYTSEEKETFYQYSNGLSTFDITILSDTETKIPFYLEDDPQEYYFSIRNDPKSLEDIPFYGNLANRIINDEAVVITIDPTQDLEGKTVVAAYELINVLGNELLYNKIVYTTVSEPYEDKTVVTCDNANDANTVIFLTLGEETQVYAYEYCIVVMATDEDELIRAADRLALHFLGIMP
ncbi:hypothetical protein CL616_00350 [archaeon]|nr:hypothetical protein [archaeon]